MPYITPRDREPLDECLDNIRWEELDVGGLTYVLYYAIVRYLAVHPVRYHVLADVLGALATVNALVVSEKLIPYEKTKMQENGGIE